MYFDPWRLPDAIQLTILAWAAVRVGQVIVAHITMVRYTRDQPPITRAPMPKVKPEHAKLYAETLRLRAEALSLAEARLAFFPPERQDEVRATLLVAADALEQLSRTLLEDEPN